MSNRKYFCFCESNCKFETMSKEQILAAIAQAAETGLTIDEDAAFITKVKEMNAGGMVTFWVGTQAQYNALDSIEEHCLYIITDKQANSGDMGEFVEDAEFPGCYYHESDGEKEWLNPPLVAGTYRTTERWNGQPVYISVELQNIVPYPANMQTKFNVNGTKGAGVVLDFDYIVYVYNENVTPKLRALTHRANSHYEVTSTMDNLGVNLVVTCRTDSNDYANATALAWVKYTKA